jgi:putative endonuclease
MITNRKNNMIYVDLINDRAIKFLVGSDNLADGFVKNYKVNKLIYYESISNIATAIDREKEIRNLSRDKKNKLVETINPGWINLMNNMKV